MKPSNVLVCLNILILIFVGDSTDAASVVEPRIVVLEHASFVNYLTQTNNLTYCFLRFKNIEIELDLNSQVNNEYLPSISSLGRGLCGFKFTNATEDLNNLDWTLRAADFQQPADYLVAFNVYIVKRPDAQKLHSKIEASMGQSVTLTCGDRFVQQFCDLYNPTGELIHNIRDSNCQYIISSFGMHDIGVWSCYVGSIQAMEEIHYTIELVAKGDEAVVTWVNETDEYVNIGCQIMNCKSCSVNSCKMIMPNEQVLNLQPSIATERYTAIETDLRQAVCAMQIKKPLEEFEKGSWQCEMQQHTPTGAIINVGETESASYPKYLVLKTQIDQSFTVFCKVPYSSNYCHIKAPNGTNIFTDKNGYQTRLGICSVTIKKSTSFDDGPWICSFAQETGLPDDQIIIVVNVAKIISTSWVKVGNLGEPSQIICSSSGRPLQYCRFISPNNVEYHVHNHATSSNLSYYGRGLEYGECGMTLLKTQNLDYGTWTCLTQIVDDSQYGELRNPISLWK